ncbi:nucleotide exchange factor GrpE [Porticoccus litoralis]|uniref:Protein GrpE n=1 Tax=Porticoccus litoralis TaxID=434086 RepID=A0AAW8B4B4_9GAMM|nr:nucleotide exchange factor GrpE [Porticoccus litoralis]MDP1520584.1 nucleotide exchange factor GrpE [Porticoccus litoralis]
MSTEKHNSQEPEQQQPEAEQTTETQPEESQAEESQELSVEQVLADLAEAKDHVLRTQAEMQNLRRRMERDVENAHKYALEKFVGELLPVVDNLERAISAIDVSNEEFKAVGEGIELTLKSFLDVLGRFKVDTLDPKGEAFDPELHQAMSILEMQEVKPNTVVDVFQKGYTLNGRLVRPAMVVVSKAATAQANTDGEG